MLTQGTRTSTTGTPPLKKVFSVPIARVLMNPAFVIIKMPNVILVGGRVTFPAFVIVKRKLKNYKVHREPTT